MVLARANTCFWGKKCFPLQDALRVPRVWQEAAVFPDEGFSMSRIAEGVRGAYGMHLIRCQKLSLHRRPWAPMTLSYLKAVVGHLSATDSRDHVYGVFGLLQMYGDMNHILSALITPNYRKTPDDVFRDATRYVLAASEKFGDDCDRDRILGLVNHDSEMSLLSKDKPSWTVMWDRHAKVFLTEAMAGATPNTFTRSSNIPLEDVHDPNVLRVRGYLFHNISWITDPLHESLLGRIDNLRLLRQVLFSVAQQHSVDTTSLTATSLLSSLLLLGQDGLQRLRCSEEEAADRFDNFFRRHSATAAEEKELWVLDQEFCSSISMSWCRTLFVTDGGFIGSGPKLTNEGDMLFIMENGLYIHVLRPVGQHFLYVGAAYVHGLMNGEILTQGIEPQWIDIR